MGKISDANLGIVLKLASKMSLDDDVAFFDSLDTSDCIAHEKVFKRVQRALAWERTRSFRHHVLMIAQRAAIIFLVACVCLFTAAMCIEPVRAAIIEAIITWYADFVEIRHVNEVNDENPTTIENVMLPAGLSDDWVVTKVHEDAWCVVHSIQGPNGEFIELEQSLIPTSGSVAIDNTDCTIEEIQLNDHTTAYLASYPNGRVMLLWRDEYEYTVSAKNITRELLLTMVDNLQ